MNNYELMVLLKPQAEATVKKHLTEIQKQLKDLKVEDLKQDYWGIKNTAYKLKGFEKLAYSVFTFKANPISVSQLLQNLNINENVVRHLLTKNS